MERFTLKTISPQHLREFEPWRFRYSALEDDSLKQSIRTVGILSPIHAVKASDAEWRILDGIKRVAIANDLKMESIPVFEWKESPDEKQGFLAGIILNSKQAWRDSDKAWVIKKTEDNSLFSENEKKMIWGLIGFSQKPEPFYKEFFNLSPACMKLAAEEAIPFRAITHILALKTSDQEELAELIRSSFTVTTNQLIQMADLLRDLLKKEKESLSRFLEKHSLNGFISQNPWDKRQRAEKLLEALRRLRRPAMYEKRHALEKEIKARKLIEKGIQIKVPDSLEGAGFSVEIRFKKPEDIKSIFQDLIKHEDFLKSLFDLML